MSMCKAGVANNCIRSSSLSAQMDCAQYNIALSNRRIAFHERGENYVNKNLTVFYVFSRFSVLTLLTINPLGVMAERPMTYFFCL